MSKRFADRPISCLVHEHFLDSSHASEIGGRMKTMSLSLGSLAIAAAFASFVAAPSASASTQPSIGIVASNWKFTPATVQLHVGQATTLRLTSSEGVHGLQSDDLGIPMTTIEPGAVKNVDVTPKKAGKYVLHCAIMCGAGHPNMTLTVNVVP
jgi:cytochrome c oxidase subunit 2